MRVPLVDLKIQYESIREQVDASMREVLESGAFILGDVVDRFEREFAEYCGSARAVGVGSGTDAIELALRACGVGAGHEVLVPAFTFAGTVFPVTLAGAKPVFVDVDPETCLMETGALEGSITSKTRAILPVHLYGRAMDLGEIERFARRHGLTIIEDACQAVGAGRRPRKAGTTGVMGVFSFYPGKNLGCYGDGGAVVTGSREMAERLLALRNYGSPRKYEHPVVGRNSRLDALQAAVLLVKLGRLDRWNETRRKLAMLYSESLRGVGDLLLPPPCAPEDHVFHLYVVRTKRRDGLLAQLNERGIGAAIHYPLPVHLHGAYAGLGYKPGDFPAAEAAGREVLSLPLYPEMTEDQLAYVVQEIQSFYR